MHRRNIVVEGIAYRWGVKPGGRELVVFPPKGGGRALTFPVARWCEDGPEDDPARDAEVPFPVHPRDVAGLIYRHFLRRPMPERPPLRPIPRPSEEPLPKLWETSAEVPRVYVVSAVLRATGRPDVALPVETHVDPATAALAAESLSRLDAEVREHYRLLGAWERGGRAWRRPMLGRPGRSDPSRPAPGLEDWLEAALAAGAGEASLAFSVAEVPLRVPADPAPGTSRWNWWARRDREVAGTMARIAAPATA